MDDLLKIDDLENQGFRARVDDGGKMLSVFPKSRIDNALAKRIRANKVGLISQLNGRTATGGAGKALSRVLPWVDAANPGCDCASYIHLMNQWGPEKCVENLASLVRWFGKVAQTLGVPATTEEIELAIFRAADECRARTRDDADVGQWPFVWTYWAGGAVGDELRYSIRSVLHHHPQARVVVVGDRPDWYHGEFIPKPRIAKTEFHAFRDCYSKLLLAAEQVPQFIWMMDDIYWIKPFSIAEAAVPKYVRHVSQQRFSAWRPKNTWAKTRAHAYRWLLENGRPTYDFAAHLPQPIVSQSFLAMERELRLMTDQYRNWECCYFNSHHAARAEDWGRRFLRVACTRESIETKHKVLNHTHSQYRGAVERFLAATFPEPCSVERSPAAPPTIVPQLQTKADWGRPHYHRSAKLDGPGERIPSKVFTRVHADFVAPFGPNEIKYLPDCLRSAAWQQAADIHLHLIPDSGAERVEIPQLPEHVTVHWYRRTDGLTDKLGPYRITNAIAARHARTPWLFICDADDISLPTRAWESIATAERHGCEQVGGQMVQWLDDDDKALASRLSLMPRWSSGSIHNTAPLGMVANPTRCIALDAFRRVNGFEAWLMSADFEFDTRSQLAGVKTYKAAAVWGLRRLRATAITADPEFGLETQLRKDLHREIVRRSKLDCQEGFGAMDQDAGLLEEIT